MKNCIVIFITILFFSCSSKKKGNMFVNGEIAGLKKGTLYLQKLKDTILFSVDSIDLKGTNTFTLTDNITEPEVFYLTFNKDAEKRIMFFGEPGTITIKDKIEEFGFKPEISGSKNHEIYTKFKKIDHKFKLKRLDFIAKNIEAKSLKNDSLINQLELDYKKMMQRRFLFTTNFAITNANYEVAPYIALSELFDANIFLLDTINKSLSNKVKNSLYGKRLNTYVKDVKNNMTTTNSK